MIARILIVIAFALVPSLATAQIIPISQIRYVEGSAEFYNQGTSDSYSDGDYQESFQYTPFDAQVAPSINFSDTYCDIYSDQISSISPTNLTAILNSGGWGENLDPDIELQSYTYSSFEVEFQLTSAHDFYLSVSGFAEGPGNGYVSLYNELGEQIFDFSVSWDNTSVDEVGTLPAGTYWLMADTAHEMFITGEGGDGGEVSLDASFDVTPASSPVGDSGVGSYLTAGPNPMSERTMIAFAGAPQRTVQLDVFDVRGRLVKRLIEGGSSSGRVAWDGRDANGRRVPQGTYFLRMHSGGEVHQQKVAVVR